MTNNAQPIFILLALTASLKDYIVDKYTDLKMGARPLKRAIQTEIEDALAEFCFSVVAAANPRFFGSTIRAAPALEVIIRMVFGQDH